jgi:hypothetical protein
MLFSLSHADVAVSLSVSRPAYLDDAALIRLFYAASCRLHGVRLRRTLRPCDERILSTDLEYGVKIATDRVLRLHRRCY